MRYVSWFGSWRFDSWFGQLIPVAGRHDRPIGRDATKPAGAAAQPSPEDLFYIAMLGPHV